MDEKGSEGRKKTSEAERRRSTCTLSSSGAIKYGNNRLLSTTRLDSTVVAATQLARFALSREICLLLASATEPMLLLLLLLLLLLDSHHTPVHAGEEIEDGIRNLTTLGLRHLLSA